MGSNTTNWGLPNPTPLDPAVKNAWGTIENTGRTLVDQAAASILSKSVAGNTNVILTNTPGATGAETPRRAYTFTGLLTGNITVFWPQNAALFQTVTNSTTGAFMLTLAVNNGSGSPAGTTLVIPQGQTLNIESDGTNIVQTDGGVVAITQQSFTVTGTYTPTAGMKYCVVEMVAPGGGGQIGNGTPPAQTFGGGGGGAGEYARGVFTSADIGTSKAVTIGAVGTAATLPSAPAGSGGNVSLGSLTAVGGGGASSFPVTDISVGGIGGTGGTGTGVHIQGGDGADGGYSPAGGLVAGGHGGASFFGGGGHAGAGGNGVYYAARAGRAYGSGGGGGGVPLSASGGAGANGGPGFVLITEYH